METYRIEEIEREMKQLRREAENAQLNMEIFGLASYTPRQLHQWKESFEEGLHRIQDNYSDEYFKLANDIPIAGINARRPIRRICIDYLTEEMVSRTRLNGRLK